VSLKSNAKRWFEWIMKKENCVWIEDVFNLFLSRNCTQKQIYALGASTQPHVKAREKNANGAHSYKEASKMNEINCPYVGWSGGCDDCDLGLEPMTCEEKLNDEN